MAKLGVSNKRSPKSLIQKQQSLLKYKGLAVASGKGGMHNEAGDILILLFIAHQSMLPPPPPPMSTLPPVDFSLSLSGRLQGVERRKSWQSGLECIHHRYREVTCVHLIAMQTVPSGCDAPHRVVGLASLGFNLLRMLASSESGSVRDFESSNIH
ncbi:hypothetical protein J6590_042692 [Homalodisca vitripennis]|nr:hypothetical protein J6590_042692 [Homalodisca vitripennis]